MTRWILGTLIVVAVVSAGGWWALREGPQSPAGTDASGEVGAADCAPGGAGAATSSEVPEPVAAFVDPPCEAPETGREAGPSGR